MKSLRVFSLLFSLVTAVGLLAVAFPAAALSNASITVTLTDYSNDCGQTPFTSLGLFEFIGMDLNYAIRYANLAGDINYDGTVLGDGYSVVVQDANGTIIGFEFAWAPGPGIDPITGNPPPAVIEGWVHIGVIGTPASRPWTITVYDRLTMPLISPSFWTSEHFLDFTLTQPVSGALTFDPAAYAPACAALPLIGGSLNAYGKLEAQIFNTEDDNGDPILHIYEINDEGDGEFSFAITQADLTPFLDNPPATNTEIKSSVSRKVTLYVLDTGEFQINIGPDEDGNVYVTIFTGLPPTIISSYTFNVYDILEG